MSVHPRSRGVLALALAVLMSLALAACSTDSPTEPEQGPTQPPGSGGSPSGSWNITVSSSRSQLETNSGRSAVITLRVRDTATNALPPDGAVIGVSTSLGEFGAAGSGSTSALLSLLQGIASISLFPGDEPGTALIAARLDQSVGQTTVQIVEPAEPSETPLPDEFFLERVEPDEGRPEGGETVRIFGQEISEPVRVFFGGLPAQVQSVSSTTIRVLTPRNDSVPPAGRLLVDVEVTINANQADEETDTLSSGFAYTREDVELQPEIFSVTPNIGPNEGGTRVTINGEGFQSPVQVTFERGASVLEAQVESVSRTQLVVFSPPAVGFGADLRNQQVDIRVLNQLNGLQTLRSNAFRYGVQFEVFGIDPSSGPYFGGTQVTIFGEGFDEPLVVDFDTVRQQVVSVTGNQILVRTVPLRVGGGCRDASLAVLVTHLETDQTAQGPDFTYLVEEYAPDILSTAPTILSQSPGVVTVNGANFNQPLELTFNGRPVILSSVTSTQIVGTFPDIPNGDLDENECNDNGDSRIGHRFVTTPFELIVTDLDTGCSDSLSVNVRPADQSCRDDVEPTPTPPPPQPTATPTP